MSAPVIGLLSDFVLDRVNLFLDRIEHRHVVVDDEIENGVEDEILAFARTTFGFTVLMQRCHSLH